MMFADDLRKSVLQAAIQGQLTEQLPTDGNASDLLKKIRSKKAKLIKAKKIKPVTLPPISDDKLPFKIPANWCWVRLGDVCTLTKGKKVSVGSLPYLDAKYLRGLKDKVLVDNGIYIAKGTKIILVDGENSGEMFEVPEDGYLGSTFQVVELSPNILADYFQYFIMLKKDFYGKNKRGSAIPHLDRQIFFSTLIPLPPLAEQERIVAKLDKILAEIELLAADERELDELEKNFPRQMKNSLLQAAIQGQLTEQLPTDGNARDLLKKIQAEKAKLIKDKKIKPVTFPPISDDELPFKIPANWCWVRLGAVCTLTKGKKVSVGSLPYLDAKYLRGLKDKVLVDSGIHISKGTRILLVDGENSGEMFEVTEDGYLGSTFQVVELSQNILADYFQYFIILKKDFYGKNKRGSAIPHLDRQIFFSTLIPLPPLAEQERIVARLDELLPLCEI